MSDDNNESMVDTTSPSDNIYSHDKRNLKDVKVKYKKEKDTI